MFGRNGIVSAVLVAALGLGAVSLISTSSFAGDCSAGKTASSDDAMLAGATSTGNIIEIATGPGMQEVTTLVTAVRAGGLVETLQGPGPFTVFAPTNDAFKKLPAGTLDSLLKPENKAQLVAVLTYHVVPGKYDAAKVTAASSFKTAQGEELQIKQMNGKWMVGNEKGWATIIKTDVQASNGVIHWIDAVVLP